MHILKILARIECPYCLAHQDDPDYDPLYCPQCDGTGQIEEWVSIDDVSQEITEQD